MVQSVEIRDSSSKTDERYVLCYAVTLLIITFSYVSIIFIINVIILEVLLLGAVNDIQLVVPIIEPGTSSSRRENCWATEAFKLSLAHSTIFLMLREYHPSYK